MVLQSGTAYTFTDGASTILAFAHASGSPSATYHIYERIEWKCTGNCASGVTFTALIANSKNPFAQSLDYLDFIIIHKTTAGALISQSTSPLDATPDLSFGIISGISITHANS